MTIEITKKILNVNKNIILIVVDRLTHTLIKEFNQEYKLGVEYNYGCKVDDFNSNTYNDQNVEYI